MIDSPDEIFGSDDASLFECNDKDLKAKAIRNSIIPRLLEIVRGCVTEIRRVYGVDAFDVSTLCWSPHSAESRGKGYACDFRSASAGLEVKRVKGRPMRILELRLLLSRKGVWPKGGKDTLDNFQTLCRECNIGKSNKSQKDLRSIRAGSNVSINAGGKRRFA